MQVDDKFVAESDWKNWYFPLNRMKVETVGLSVVEAGARATDLDVIL